MLERELDRLGVRAPPLPEILGDLGLETADALYQGLGEGDITLAQVAGAIHRRMHEHQEVQRGPRLTKPAAGGGSAGMVIDGVGDLLVERYQMTGLPQAFLSNPDVMRLVREQQMAALPITVVRGQVDKVGAYPTLNEVTTYLMEQHRTANAQRVQVSPALGGNGALA